MGSVQSGVSDRLVSLVPRSSPSLAVWSRLTVLEALLNHTAGNWKLGEGLGTRLRRSAY